MLAVGAGSGLGGHFFSRQSFLSSFSLSSDIDLHIVSKGR